ncbi:hypothetical protein PV664_36850 [Streptomyces sp. ME01-18a]|nr:hypothetical protein [Streptomyces sp. ME01-18a]
MRIRAYVGALAVAAAIVAAPGSAFATDTPGINWDHVWTATGVKLYVEEHGDIVSVCDTSANGIAASAVVLVEGEAYSRYQLTTDGGAGTCVTAEAGDGGKFDLPEGKYIALSYDGNGGEEAFAQYLNDH